MAGTGVGKFSSTAGSNTSNLTVNFAENMAPSNVNNAARELMGHIRDMYEQLGDGYFEFGDGDGEYTVARSDADTITITSSSDISGVYFAGRKIRITDGGANVVEGTIASSSHTSTTQTVNLTGISLASGTPTKVELGIDTAAFGGRIILDDDGDTYIEAVTDDTIDIYVAGAKDFVITANTFTAPSGSTIVVDDTTDASNTTSGSIQTDGGVGIAKKLFVGTDLDVDGTANLDIVDIDGAVDMASTLQVDGAITTSDGMVITTGDVNPQLTIICTDGGNNAAPIIDIYRNSGTPADADVLGQLRYYGENSADEKIEYVRVKAFIEDVTDGDEASGYSITTYTAGAQYGRINIDETITVLNENSADIDFRVESNDVSDMFYVDGGNNSVLVHKSSPSLRYFNSTDFKPGFEIFGTGNTEQRVSAFTYGSADAGGHLMCFGKSRSATPDNYSVVQDEDQLGRITFQGADGTDFVSGAQIHSNVDGTPGANDMPARLTFHTCADGGTTLSERMRIDNQGRIGLGESTLTSNRLNVTHNTSNEGVATFKHDHAVPEGIFIRFGGAAPDNTTANFIEASDTGTTRFQVQATGNVQNHDNSYGQISDERIKQNITDANSQWDDIKALKVKNFERKDDVAAYGEGKNIQIGLIAQECEAVSPGLVDEQKPSSSDIEVSSDFGTLYTSDDPETQNAVLYTADDWDVIEGDKNVGDIKKPSTKQIGDIKSYGEQVKAIKYSVLYMKAIKALQEAMDRIETLEAKVNELEG